MKFRTIFFLLFIAVQNAGCGWFANDFEMTVEHVDELKGFILKGISITGKVTVGCIANEDEYVVKRNGKEILKTITRIVNVEGLKDPESFAGKVFKDDYVTFYIPDGKPEDVAVGDIVVSKIVSCNKEAAKK